VFLQEKLDEIGARLEHSPQETLAQEIKHQNKLTTDLMKLKLLDNSSWAACKLGS
jgi:hypothetical protein